MVRKGSGCFLSFILAAVIALGGCGTEEKGSGQDNSQQAAEEAKNYIYKEEEIAFEGLDVSDASGIVFADGKFIVNGTKYGETGSYDFYMTFDEKGKRLSHYEAEEGTGEMENSFVVGSNGDIYAIMTKDITEGSGEDMTYRMEQYLVRRNPDGTEKERISLSERASAEEYFYANRLMSDGKGNLMVSANGVLMLFNEEMEFEKLIQISEDVGETLLGRDGRVILISYSEKGMVLRCVDVSTGQLSEEYVLAQSRGYSCYAGADCDLLLTTDKEVYRYNFGDAEPVKLMDYVDSDLDAYSLNNVISAGEGKFFARYFSAGSGSTHFSQFTKVAPEEVKDKITLTVGGVYIDSDIMSRIVRFNKESDKYHIRMLDYSVYNTDEDGSAGRTRLHQDIIAGNIPDIMVLDNDMPIESYMEKGLFADLNPYMDGENGIDRSRFLNNIFEAYSRDGKLYQLVPAFYVSTMIGKTALVGEKADWNYDEFAEFIAGIPQGTAVFSNTTRDMVLQRFMEMSGGEFVDWQNGTCNFNSEHFISFLRLLSTIPKEIDDSVYEDQESFNRMQAAYRNNEAFLSMVTVSDFSVFQEWREGVFGEDITFVGFPSEQGSGSAIVPLQRFAISSQAADKEAAWQFLKIFLEDEYQNSIYGLPISLAKLNQMAEESRQNPYYTDEQGNKIEYNASYWMGDVEIPLHPLREEDTRQIQALLESLSCTVRTDNNIINIITEEAEAFFEGEKSAEEVAEIIQGRVQLYINESN